jgi:hypothetical protein
MVFCGTIWNVTFQRFCLFVLRWIQNKHHIARGRTILLILVLQLGARSFRSASVVFFFQNKSLSQFINWDSEAVCTLPFCKVRTFFDSIYFFKDIATCKEYAVYWLESSTRNGINLWKLEFLQFLFYVSVIYETTRQPIVIFFVCIGEASGAKFLQCFPGFFLVILLVHFFAKIRNANI